MPSNTCLDRGHPLLKPGQPRRDCLTVTAAPLEHRGAGALRCRDAENWKHSDPGVQAFIAS